MTRPLVTILIPTYNRAELLREAIESAVSQTFEQIEVLILDDASGDVTSEVAAEFSADSRVRYVRHPHNLGIVGNWKCGIEMAKGEFFCILHDDDTFEASFVAKLVQPMLLDECLILAFSDHWVMDQDGVRSGTETQHATTAFKRDVLTHGLIDDWAYSALIDGSIPVGATMFRKNLIDLEFIQPQAKGAIDAWLFYQCARLGRPIYYVPERLMNYRLHDGGMSQRVNPAMEEGHIYRCRQLLADPKMSKLHRPARLQLASALSRSGMCLLASGDSKAARTALRQSLSMSQSSRAYIAYGLACSGSLGATVARAITSL